MILKRAIVQNLDILTVDFLTTEGRYLCSANLSVTRSEPNTYSYKHNMKLTESVGLTYCNVYSWTVS